MPFESVLEGSSDRVRSARLGQIITATCAFYATLISFAALKNGWHVEELSAPQLPLMLFVPRQPTPAPPFNPPKVTPSTPKITAANRSRLVNPPPRSTEPTVAAPAEVVPNQQSFMGASTVPADGPGQMGAGDKGALTQVGSSDPGTGIEAPSVLPPKLGAQQCISCPTPQISPALLQVASKLTMASRICVDKSGRVTSVDVRQGVSATIDAQVVGTVRGWRFSPMTINGHPVPFCYPAVFVWKSVP